jgi:hypothetical protein
MKSRARRSKLGSYSSEDDGAGFLGSADFPEALIDTCKKYDPKGILFGTDVIPAGEYSSSEKARLRSLMDARIRGKRFLVLSGGKDKLVPYSASKPFLDYFKNATRTWYEDGGLYVDDRVYAETGHTFDEEMRKDALKFILETVALADAGVKLASPKI